VTQFEQENDVGRGGGELDEEALDEAWERRERLVPEGEDPAEDADYLDEEIERRS
jgi:hypothetical protein